MAIFGKQNPDKGLSAKFDRSHRFTLRRERTPLGSHQYQLENTARHEKLMVPRFLLDRFRLQLSQLMMALKNHGTEWNCHETIFFKDEECYQLHLKGSGQRQIQIKGENGRGLMVISEEALPSLLELLYHPDLDHPSDLLDAIIDYHSLFSVSFASGSESISSGLILRKDILGELDRYVPTTAMAQGDSKNFVRGADFKEGDLRGYSPSSSEPSGDLNFKSKLGQRQQDRDYEVNYEAIFKGMVQEDSAVSGGAQGESKRSTKKKSNSFPLPILASDLKRAKSKKLKVELSSEDAKFLRDEFLKDRSVDLYLGLEMMDAVHRSGSGLRSYRFPLYYMKVKVEEAGRFLHISPPKGGDIFVNHIAILHMVERFGAGQGDESLHKFLANLKAQKIDLASELHPFKIHRQLPYSDEVFHQTREILIGEAGEGGKGGLLHQLKLIGIACDLEGVTLYRVSKAKSPSALAINHDLAQIKRLAHREPQKFYHSSLGRLLVPERRQDLAKDPLFKRPLNPGYRPKSTVDLMEQLDEKDLVLLEGPPGTGKTFTIMNLFIHCVNEGKRLLIVSDQKAAIHALTEKLEEYLLGDLGKGPETEALRGLWRNGIPVIDETPTVDMDHRQWIAKLEQMLSLDTIRSFKDHGDAKEIGQKIASLDKRFEERQVFLGELLAKKMGRDGSSVVAAKRDHPTTEGDIRDLLEFLRFMGVNQEDPFQDDSGLVSHRQLVLDFVSHRSEILGSELAPCYEDLAIIPSNIDRSIADTLERKKVLEALMALKPRRLSHVKGIFKDHTSGALLRLLLDQFKAAFHPKTPIHRKFLSVFKHPLMAGWKSLHQCLTNQHMLLELLARHEKGGAVLRQLQYMHRSLDPNEKSGLGALALEICGMSGKELEGGEAAIQKILEELKAIQGERDGLVRALFIAQMAAISEGLLQAKKSGTNEATTIMNLLASLKEAGSIDYGSGKVAHLELRKALKAAFPIWICRKQNVSFLFPLEERSFDLVVVDEAGQCRVDDALPLLYRAKRLMAVGDERQTVLDKNSPVDDYLFHDFDLEELLRNSQARGMKGGGSNLFSLLKSVKEGGVMLDEHYRCPPDIIRYSNEYVYDSQLRIMQWTEQGAPPSVVVDYSEERKSPSRKPPSGKYKSIEVDMIDRFLSYVETQILAIEKERGRAINMETDVALCYFLLKNESYMKDKKAELLQRLNRGRDVLDGAGAALQGKERDYIFYFWDINRSNLAFFRQGDDPDKRKGELNVLMSRPKVRSYHFLHHGFKSLNHDGASIADYLWRAYQRQGQEAEGKRIPRTRRPSSDFTPWQRSSGDSIHAILSQVLAAQGMRLGKTQASVVVGDPRRRVDLVLKAKGRKSIGVVDCSAFADSPNPSVDMVDYYFQLQRVNPKIEPVFAFLHELADERSYSFEVLKQWLHKQSGKKAA